MKLHWRFIDHLKGIPYMRLLLFIGIMFGLWLDVTGFNHFSLKPTVQDETMNPNFELASEINSLQEEKHGILIDRYLKSGDREYFVVWNRDLYTYTLTVNLTLTLEQVGITSPDFEFTLFRWDYFTQGISYLRNYSTSSLTPYLKFTCLPNSRYILQFTNLHPSSAVSYDISFRTTGITGFYTTPKYDIDADPDFTSQVTTITEFGSADPVLFRLEGDSPYRIIIENSFAESSNRYEFYYLLENTGTPIDAFIGFIAESWYSYYYPSLTIYIIDWEYYGDDDAATYGFTVSNDSFGFSYTFQEDHKYSLWISAGSYEYPIDFWMILDTFGERQLFYEQFTDDKPPNPALEIIYASEDPYLHARNLRRIFWFGGTSGVVVVVMSVGWWIRRRSY